MPQTAEIRPLGDWATPLGGSLGGMNTVRGFVRLRLYRSHLDSFTLGPSLPRSHMGPEIVGKSYFWGTLFCTRICLRNLFEIYFGDFAEKVPQLPRDIIMLCCA